MFGLYVYFLFKIVNLKKIVNIVKIINWGFIELYSLKKNIYNIGFK